MTVAEHLEAPAVTPAQQLERRMALLTVFAPPLATLAALGLAAFRGWHALDLALCAGMYLVTMLGITAGHHRLFTHRAYQAPPAVRAALGIAGAMAGQGPLLFWVAAHRRHHQHADRPGDPHSPWLESSGRWTPAAGFWHAHVGWMLGHAPEDWARLVPDLLKDDLAMRLNTRYFHWLLAGLLLPALIGGLLAGPEGALGGLLWGGFVRLALVHHATWLVNSWCHMVGRRPHDTPDRSTNSWACALLTFGEGWHNNHHAAPACARHGQGPWQPDLTYGLIRTLQALGLATQLVGMREEPTR